MSEEREVTFINALNTAIQQLVEQRKREMPERLRRFNDPADMGIATKIIDWIGAISPVARGHLDSAIRSENFVAAEMISKTSNRVAIKLPDGILIMLKGDVVGNTIGFGFPNREAVVSVYRETPKEEAFKSDSPILFWGSRTWSPIATEFADGFVRQT